MSPFFSRHLSLQRVASLTFVAATLITAAPPGALGCSECGCVLSSDWAAQGYPEVPGLTASVRYEYYDSNDLRSGSHSVNRAALALPADREVQQDTLDRNTWLGLDYVGPRGWAIAAQLPHFSRYHSTIGEGDSAVSESRAAGIGDLRLLGRWQKDSMYRSYGIQFGLKLPTGRFDQTFVTGPQAGMPLDRGLQLGSGTTDLLLGASYFRRPTVHVGWFAQITAEQPIAARAGYLPSANVAANTGIRYLNTTRVTPQLQVNARWDAREHGPASDRPNSGGLLAYLSPGATVELGPRASGSVFLQLPVFRRVNGWQLEPHTLLSFGFTYKL